MTQNPFESPVSNSTHIDELPKTVQVDLFKVDTSNFNSSIFTSEMLVELIHGQVCESCTQQGLILSKEVEPSVIITGTVSLTEEPSHPFWKPFWVSVIELHIEGFITIQEDRIHPFKRVDRYTIGFLIGISKVEIENSIRQLSFEIACKAASRAEPGRVQNNLLSIFYLLGTLLVSTLASILSGRYCSPVFLADLSTASASSHVPAKLAAVVISGFLIVLGLSFAFVPKRILQGAVLRWIAVNSGMKSEFGFRASFFFLALFFIIVYLFALFFKG